MRGGETEIGNVVKVEGATCGLSVLRDWQSYDRLDEPVKVLEELIC